MPKSRFVSARRLKPLILYLALAFAALLVADATLDAAWPARGARQVMVLLWFVVVPVGAWLVWRRA